MGAEKRRSKQDVNRQPCGAGHQRVDQNGNHPVPLVFQRPGSHDCSEKHPEGTEKRLKELIPEQEWGEAHHLLIFHGRRVCQARKPECTSCTLREICKNACQY
jgi:adenine-specific DNA glycosylase